MYLEAKKLGWIGQLNWLTLWISRDCWPRCRGSLTWRESGLLSSSLRLDIWPRALSWLLACTPARSFAQPWPPFNFSSNFSLFGFPITIETIRPLKIPKNVLKIFQLTPCLHSPKGELLEVIIWFLLIVLIDLGAMDQNFGFPPHQLLRLLSKKMHWLSPLIQAKKPSQNLVNFMINLLRQNLWLKVSNTDSRRAEPELFVDMLKIECRLVWSGVVRTDEGFEWTTFGWWRENFAFKVAKLDFRRLFLGLGEVTRELRSDLVGDREAGVSALETEFGHSILPLRRCGRLYFIFN